MLCSKTEQFMPSENNTTTMGMETFMKFIHAIQKVHKGIFFNQIFLLFTIWNAVLKMYEYVF